jgi:acyl carrier protein|tara:strand:+ start:84 stop:320 length:237 start_codon:yes stop_codon:yes gene_type:complete
MSIQSRIISLTATQLDLGEDEISLDSNFMKDLGADSLDTVELILNIEDEFGIEIPDNEIEEMHTVKSMLNYLTSVGIS